MSNTTEILHKYVDRLNEGQQESLLSFLRTLLPDIAPAKMKAYDDEITNAMKRVEGGDLILHEDVEEASKKW